MFHGNNNISTNEPALLYLIINLISIDVAFWVNVSVDGCVLWFQPGTLGLPNIEVLHLVRRASTVCPLAQQIGFAISGKYFFSRNENEKGKQASWHLVSSSTVVFITLSTCSLQHLEFLRGIDQCLFDLALVCTMATICYNQILHLWILFPSKRLVQTPTSLCRADNIIEDRPLSSDINVVSTYVHATTRHQLTSVFKKHSKLTGLSFVFLIRDLWKQCKY